LEIRPHPRPAAEAARRSAIACFAAIDAAPAWRVVERSAVLVQGRPQPSGPPADVIDGGVFWAGIELVAGALKSGPQAL